MEMKSIAAQFLLACSHWDTSLSALLSALRKFSADPGVTCLRYAIRAPTLIVDRQKPAAPRPSSNIAAELTLTRARFGHQGHEPASGNRVRKIEQRVACLWVRQGIKDLKIRCERTPGKIRFRCRNSHSFTYVCVQLLARSLALHTR